VIHRVAVFLVCLFVAGLRSVALASDENPDEIIRSAVSAIDGHYLYAQSNAMWAAAKARMLQAKYKDSDEAYQALIHELSTLGDSELNVISKSQLAELQKDTSGERIGIGLVDFSIDRDPGGKPRIVTPIFGTPSAESGVQPGDIIEAVNGKTTESMLHEEVVEELRRQTPSGTELELRRGKTHIRLLVHAKEAKLDAVQVETKMNAGRKIGYIRIVQFTPEAGQQVRIAVSRFERESITAYILDLRNNPGGLLTSAVAAANAFTGGTLGFAVHLDGKPEPIDTTEPVLTKNPVIVLMNCGTASAAEVLAAALQSHARATIVGTPSYGRGQSQRYYPLTEGYGLVVPSAVMQTPAGKEFKGEGLVPDVRVSQDSVTLRTAATERDALFVRALAVLTQRTKSGSQP
jgi:carboxyl-terminal processing protease